MSRLATCLTCITLHLLLPNAKDVLHESLNRAGSRLDTAHKRDQLVRVVARVDARYRLWRKISRMRIDFRRRVAGAGRATGANMITTAITTSRAAATWAWRRWWRRQRVRAATTAPVRAIVVARRLQNAQRQVHHFLQLRLDFLALLLHRL